MAATKNFVDLLQEVRDSQLRSEGVCIACREKVDEHTKTLYGNGTRGLKYEHGIMWAVFTWATRLLAGGGLVALVSGLVWLVQHVGG